MSDLLLVNGRVHTMQIGLRTGLGGERLRIGLVKIFTERLTRTPGGRWRMLALSSPSAQTHRWRSLTR